MPSGDSENLCCHVTSFKPWLEAAGWETLFMSASNIQNRSYRAFLTPVISATRWKASEMCQQTVGCKSTSAIHSAHSIYHIIGHRYMRGKLKPFFLVLISDSQISWDRSTSKHVVFKSPQGNPVSRQRRHLFGQLGSSHISRDFIVQSNTDYAAICCCAELSPQPYRLKDWLEVNVKVHLLIHLDPTLSET